MTPTTSAAGTTATTTGIPSGHPSGVRWVSVAQAVAELGITERTIRRGITSGRFVSVVQDGRRVIRIEGEPDTRAGGNEHRHPSGPPTGGAMVEIKPNPSGMAGGDLVIRQAVEIITEPIRAELTRARRAAAWGWTAAAAGFVLLAVGGLWGVRAVEQAKGQAGAADAARGILADDLARERRQAEGLAVELRAERQQHRAEIEGIRQRQALAGVSDMLSGVP